MKVRVTLKDPDTMQDAVYEAAKLEVKTLEGLSKSEREAIAETRAAEATEIIASKWMEYGEYLVVDFDTEARTAVVVAIE